MLRYELSIDIERPVGDVFVFIAEPANGPTHDPAVLSARRTSPGPIGGGPTFHQVARDPLGANHTFQVHILEYRPPSKLEFHETGSAPGHERTTYVFQATRTGTKLLVPHRGIDLRLPTRVAVQAARTSEQQGLAALGRLKH